MVISFELVDTVPNLSRSTNMTTKLLCMVLTSGAFVLSATFAADRSNPSPKQLERYLQRNPGADRNKDGELTVDEAKDSLRRLKSGAITAPPATTVNAPDAETPGAKTKAGKKAQRSADLPPPDFGDVSYGSHPNNKLDVWLAKSDRPTPLVVFIHGGGFVAGDKRTVSTVTLKQCLDAGVTFAAINYRFRTEASINTVLRDSARAIQFLRSQSKTYNIDKARVAAYGGSAGAGTSLWLAFHDDLADPQSDDPVLRESTRLVAAASSAGQATYDILKWKDVLGTEEAMRFYPESTWPAFYGLKTKDELFSENGKKLRADVDMLGLITKDDAPVWLGASDGHEALANKGDTNHSPKHSEAVKKRCDEVGVPAVLKIGAELTGGREPSQIEFLFKHLGVTRPEN